MTNQPDPSAAPTEADPKIYAEEFAALARAGVPLAAALDWRIERWAAGAVAIRMPYSDLLRRPGGTISGPALMGLADITLYGVVLSLIGPAELAVTTDLSFHFLARPKPVAVLAEGRILTLGRRLAVGEVVLHADDRSRPLCHAVGSYAIPPDVG